MTYEQIVAGAKEAFESKDMSKVDGHLAVQINITGEGEGAFYVELNDHKLYVEPYEYYDRDVILTASAKTFIGLSNGKIDAVLAYTTGKIKIEGPIEKALEFQKIIKAD